MPSFAQHRFYPYSGRENPAKNMVNVRLRAGTNGERVRAVVEEIWMPRLEQFEPQMILVSAGFDAHREDDLGQMSLVEADYAYMTARLLELAARHCGGPLVRFLAGRYNPTALAPSAG